MFVLFLVILIIYEVYFGIEEGLDKLENEVNYLWYIEGFNKMSFIFFCLKKKVFNSRYGLCL